VRYFFCIVIATLFSIDDANAQKKSYWQQLVNCTIQAQLDDVTHSIDGFEQIQYTNRSPDTLTFIWFHLWPNAYKNDRTAFSEQLLKNGRTDFYFSADSSKGYISNLSFTVNNHLAKTEPHQQHIDIVKLLLPKPVLPNETIVITTPFHVQLPLIFSRSGHLAQSYQVAQWFPKPAVYDQNGWHEMTYLDQGEFYSEFGNYDVTITVPENYWVAATGVLQTKEELVLLQQTALQQPILQKSYLQYQQALKIKQSKQIIHPEYLVPASSQRLKTLRFTQNNTHDFAWFASKQFIVATDSIRLQQKQVDVFVFYYPWQIKEWEKATQYTKSALAFYDEKVGNYPYQTATVVAGASVIGSSGMEYPSITLITTQEGGKNLDLTIAHEIGHNWFYGALASNERAFAWMDEGMNSFYEKWYEREKYPPLFSKANNFHFLQKKIPNDIDLIFVKTIEKLGKAQAIQTSSEVFSNNNYGLFAYTKAARWMQDLQSFIGIDSFNLCIKKYYQQWQFKHPNPTDFKEIVQIHTSKNVDSIFSLLNNPYSSIRTVSSKKVKPVFLFNVQNTDSFNYVSLAPLVGMNKYDGLMIGGMIHNYQLPLNKFQFIVAPMFATNSKQFNLFSRASYNVYKPKYWLSISNSFSSFTINQFTPNEAATLYLGVRKMVPSVKLTFYNKEHGSSEKLSVQLRSFLLKEEQLQFSTITTPTDTFDVVGKNAVNTAIHQLNIQWSNDRVLYPYLLNVTIDKGKNFVRAALTGNYFLNYSSRKGGVDVRFFAGKFFYTTAKTFVSAYETSRYHINMTGANGNEDYTYSDYFFARNAFDGFASQQIMQRDGFFKVRTDLYSSKVGKTDNWLMALNVSGDIPDQYNPLKVLPFKIPLKYFFDIGTHAESWQENAASSKFLYDAGIEVSLLKEMLHIYFPILSSKVFRDYNKSVLGENRFWKTVSFSVNLQQLRLTKISRDIPL